MSLLRKIQIFSSNVAKLWAVDDANTARTTSTVVGAVQVVDQTGKVPPAGDAVGNAPFVKITDGTNTAAIDDANTARTTGTKVQAVQNVDATGKVMKAGDTISNAPIVKNTNYDSSGNEIFNRSRPAYVRIGDGSNANLDAFGRLRTANPASLFESQMQYNLSPLFWESNLTGAASVTHLPNESSARLRCTTASGDKVIRQTKRYFRYQAGKSQLIELTGIIGDKKANVRQRIGYFDTNNGLFFEQDENNLKVVRRTYVSGSPVDNAVNQSSWNIDTLDGNGESGITLDMSKTHIFVIDLQWLGVGRVRFGFVINGDLIYCHEVLNANSLTNVYMTTANLPLRYEIENTAGTASTTDMIQICGAVMSEGGYDDEYGITHSASNGITSIGVTTRRPILSIRPSTTFNSITNRGHVQPLDYGLYATTNAAFIELVVNGSLTGAAFGSAGSNSIVDYDVTASAISGGDIIDSSFIAASASTKESVTNAIKNKLILANDYAGTTTDILTVVATSFSGTSNLSASLTWKELY